MQLEHVRLTTLLLALICFVLPWIQIRCDSSDGGELVVSQSGLQATYGSTTTYVNGRPVQEKGQPIEQMARKVEPAWLLGVHAAAIVMALLAGQWIKREHGRGIWVTVLCTVAAGALIVQVVIGFPMLRDVPEEVTEHLPWYWLAIISSVAAPIVCLCEALAPATRKPSREDPFAAELGAWDVPPRTP